MAGMTDQSEIREEDIRAAVAAGVIEEDQARALQTYVQDRRGFRGGMTADDEPFVLFSGFSEIFVSIGLILLYLGLAGLLGASAPYAAVGISIVLAFYYTRRRRMTLPSIVIAIAFAAGAAYFITPEWEDFRLRNPATVVLSFSLPGLVAMAVYYWAFRLPFALFLFGLFGFATMFGAGLAVDAAAGSKINDFALLAFDLRRSGTLGLSSLLFGLMAFAGAMYFDMKDPHRIGRHSACGFWLHIVAAPALTNTILLTLYNLETGFGYALTVCALLLLSLVAIVIDRRSLLTVGIAYAGTLLGWALSQTGVDGDAPVILLLLGLLVTPLGTWWTAIRVRLMQALPNFPLKERLPPYGAG